MSADLDRLKSLAMAAVAFAKSHVDSDALERLADEDEEFVTHDEFRKSCDNYNSTKATFIALFAESMANDGADALPALIERLERAEADLAWHKESLAAHAGKLRAVWDGIREHVEEITGAPCGPEPFDSLAEATKQRAAELRHWKANHADMVKRCAFLSERDDLPIDRIPAYARMSGEIERLNGLVKLQREALDIGSAIREMQSALTPTRPGMSMFATVADYMAAKAEYDAARPSTNQQAMLDAARYHYVRTLNPRQFAELCTRNIAGEGAFDDLVDAAMTKGVAPSDNTGHGHVHPRADGVRMRCGGPGICAECSQDAARAIESLRD